MTTSEENNVTIKVCVDVVLTILIGIPSVVLLGVEPFHRGFYCDDETISYPYKPDTISTALAGSVGAIIPLTAIIVGELLAYRDYLKKRKDLSCRLDSTYTRTYKFAGRRVHAVVVTLYCVIGAFVLGIMITQTTSNMIKYSGGRLRPHFLTVCEVDHSRVQCTDPSTNLPLYIEDDNVCLGDEELIKEARLSHPSGHSSYAMYTMLFMALYLQSRFRWTGSRVLRPFLQVSGIYLALYTCLSRVSDYKHHWSDVLAGALIGTIIALVTAIYMSNMFPRHPIRQLSKRMSELNLLCSTANVDLGYGSQAPHGGHIGNESRNVQECHTNISIPL